MDVAQLNGLAANNPIIEEFITYAAFNVGRFEKEYLTLNKEAFFSTEEALQEVMAYTLFIYNLHPEPSNQSEIITERLYAAYVLAMKSIYDYDLVRLKLIDFVFSPDIQSRINSLEENFF